MYRAESNAEYDEKENSINQSPEFSGGSNATYANTMHSDLFVPAIEKGRNLEVERELRDKIKQLQQALNESDDRQVSEKKLSDKYASCF